MKDIKEKIDFCPLRHPSLDFRNGVCFYSSQECSHKNPEECKIYKNVGREYSLRSQEYKKGLNDSLEKID